MQGHGDGRDLEVMGRGKMGNAGKEIAGSMAMGIFEDQNKEFVLDVMAATREL